MYQVVIGKFYAPATLGQYTRAKGFSTLFSENLSGVVQRVSFPVLSEIQDDKVRLKMGYQHIIKTSMLVTFSCMLLLCAVAKSMIIVLIGEKWIQAAYFLQIICFGGMLYPLHAINLNMLQVQGRSDLFLKLEIVKKAIAVFPLLIGIFVDIYYMLIGSVITGLVSYYINAYYSGYFIHYSIKEQIKDILPSFCIGFLGAFFAYLPSLFQELHLWDGNWNRNAFFIFPAQLIIGIVSIVCMYEITHNDEYEELKSIILSFVHKFLHHR